MDGVLSDMIKEDQMNPKLFKLFVSCSAAAMSAAVGSFALAQVPAPPPPPPGAASPAAPNAAQPPAGTSYASQLPETRGTVQRFTLTPIGEIDGVILADGTEVHLPPHLTTQLASAVRVGDTVTVQGYRSSYVPLIVAASITDASTGQTVVDNGPPPPGSRPPPPPPGMPAPGAQQTTVQGRVQMPLYGPRGDLNGALLADGTIVRIGPMEAYQVASLLNPGQPLAVQGWGLTTAYGRVVDAQAVGPSSGQMTQVGPPAFPAPPGYPLAPPAPPPPR
jgi:hypothetical protein